MKKLIFTLILSSISVISFGQDFRFDQDTITLYGQTRFDSLINKHPNPKSHKNFRVWCNRGNWFSDQEINSTLSNQLFNVYKKDSILIYEIAVFRFTEQQYKISTRKDTFEICGDKVIDSLIFSEPKPDYCETVVAYKDKFGKSNILWVDYASLYKYLGYKCFITKGSFDLYVYLIYECPRDREYRVYDKLKDNGSN